MSKPPIKEWPEEDRPREKLLKKGAKHLTDVELLAILLRTGADGNALDLARELLLTFDGLKGLKEASSQEMSKVKGVGAAKASAIMSAFELGSRMDSIVVSVKKPIRKSHEVFLSCCSYFKGLKKEIFKILMLNAKNCVIGGVEISVGTLTSNIVHPREVFNPAIKSSAASIILIHNHPSGDPEPSNEDKTLTKRMKEAGQLVGIPVLDHIIIGDGRYFSFLDEGLI